MPNWSESMQQTYEYYVVDPGTWKDIKQLTNVTRCSIDRDSSADTLGSARIDITDTIEECYVRCYLITIQNGVRERHPLGTFLVQTPSTSFDGKTTSVSVDAYTPLIELKEKLPPLGYYIAKNTNVMDISYRLVRENLRAPVVEPESDTVFFDNFVANTSENWLRFLTDSIKYAKYEFDIDEYGRILFSPIRETASLSPIWTYDDSNSSILYPDISMDRDIYGIPNAVEVLYSDSGNSFYHKIVNDDPNSPVSTVSRGREILYRETNPSIIGNPTNDQVEEYARRMLKELSTIEYSVTYKHGYCPVRVGDCVRLNYAKAGLNNVVAKVVSQSIDCVPGCPVSEKAVFTKKLWGE